MWLALFGLIYVLRDFFALVFLTFLLVSFTLPAINYLTRETRIPRKVIIVSIYAMMFAVLCGMIWYVVPRVLDEAVSVASEVKTESVKARVDDARQQVEKHYPTLKPLLAFVDRKDIDWQSYVKRAESEMQLYLKDIAKLAITAISTIFLSLLFAFLIVLDLTRLREEVRKLGRSRLHDFYEQSAEPVVRFAAVIAQSFRAQAVIAVCNTSLTLIGFYFIGLPKIALLSIVVFLFSFVPVLGVFISTAPAILVGLNSGGYEMGAKVVLFVVVVHLVEAYVLNPLIYGRHLKLNPVLVLIILYVGHHFFGIWGMLLGVPVAYYFIHYVFKVPPEVAANVFEGKTSEEQAGPTDSGEPIIFPPGESAARAPAGRMATQGRDRRIRERKLDV